MKTIPFFCPFARLFQSAAYPVPVRRATDAEEVIQGRLQKAREECKQIPNYDYLVVNDKVSEAAGEIIAILTAESCRTKHRINLVEGV